MSKLTSVKLMIILMILTSIYVLSVINLNNVIMAGGTITPIVNLTALLGLIVLGLLAGIFFISTGGLPIFNFLSSSSRDIKKHHFYILLFILIFYKLFAFLITPNITQYMWVWPDSVGYLYDMQRILQNPASIFDGSMKSPLYAAWLALNNLTFAKLMDPMSSKVYFNTTVFLKDFVPPLFLQNIMGILSALICFSVFSKINIILAYAATLLSFLNPTALAVDNSLLRESLAMFFVLSAFAVFLKAVNRERPIYGFIAGIIFVLAYQTRPEMLVIYILLSGILFIHSFFRKRGIRKVLLLFILPLVLSIFFSYNMSAEYATKTNKGRFGIAMHGLRSRCYFYNSPTFPGFIENMQKRLTQLEKEKEGPCDAPRSTWQLVWLAADTEKARYNQSIPTENSGRYVKIESDDQIFIDIVKYNTFCYIQSLIINIGYNLIHNVENMAPILYNGGSYWISQNWTYYASPKILQWYEKKTAYHKYFIGFFRMIELYTTRKILLPFLFIGSIIILRKLFSKSGDNGFLLICIILITWAHLVFISFIAYPAARFIYVLTPFIFGIEIIGLFGVFYWFKSVLLKRVVV